jgi:hypothetical protein
MAMRLDVSCADSDQNHRRRSQVVRAGEELHSAHDVPVLLADGKEMAEALGDIAFGKLTNELWHGEPDERTPIAFTALDEPPNRLEHQFCAHDSDGSRMASSICDGARVQSSADLLFGTERNMSAGK